MTGADARMRFRILGPLTVSGAEVTAGRERTVLAMLLLRPGALVPIGDLVDALWDDAPPATAKAQVQTAVSRLRRSLTGTQIWTDRAGYGIRPARGDLDALLFADHVAQARGLAAADPDRARVLMRAALDLWRGRALDGVQSRLVRARAVALDEHYAVAVEEWADLELAVGRERAVVGDLTALVERFPLRERLRGQLMLALAAAGRQADALAEYARAGRLLIDELSIEPGVDLRRVHARILAGAPGPGPAPGGGRRPAVVVPRELPPAPRSFTARDRELRMLDDLLAEGAGGTVVISAVSGTAGIGKTTLAVHWGHRVAGRFPDGQLYVNLRGHDPGTAPLPPEAALREFLTALDVPPDRVPSGLPARSALFRSLLAGRRALVVLDNAADAGQVRPLLPASPGCMAVVTSRERLTGLVATSGAHLINLDLLSTDEARRLLTGRLGEHRVAAEPEAADKIIGACSHLPLALAIAAARALADPDRPLEKLAAELAAARLDALATGDPAADARAVFSSSYRALPPSAATLFRLLGLHPGTDFGVSSAASLLGVPRAAAQEALDELVRAQMAGARGGGRYGFHDLLRAYARELAETRDDAPARRAALGRLYDHYVRAGRQAHLLLFPQRPTFDPPPPGAGVAEERIADEPAAEAWYAAERAVLHAAAPRAAATGHDRAAWQLAYLVSAFLARAGERQPYADVAAAGLAAAERLGDRWAQALLAGTHGMAQGGLGDLDGARDGLLRAARLFEAEKNGSGVGVAELELGRLASHTGDVPAATGHARRALAAFTAAGDVAGQGKALNNLGWYRYRSGDFAGAVAYGEQALAIQRATGYRRGQADALDTVGVACHELGDLPRALACLAEAVEVSYAVGDRLGAAECLLHLGDSRRRAGDVPGARAAYREALAILDEAGDPDAGTARRKLAELGPGAPLPPPV